MAGAAKETKAMLPASSVNFQFERLYKKGLRSKVQSIRCEGPKVHRFIFRIPQPPSQNGLRKNPTPGIPNGSRQPSLRGGFRHAGHFQMTNQLTLNLGMLRPRSEERRVGKECRSR